MNDNKRVQKITLSLLKVYMDFCEKHGLRYYFTGGALIGVLRHKGFIPWDDDIDVGMPRKDFDRFIKLIKKEMPEGYGICDRYTDPNWHFALCQFIDEKTEITIHLAKQPRKAHVWIDVFPLDGLPTNSAKRWMRVKHILMYRYLVQLANIKNQVDANRKRPRYERAVLSVAKTLHVEKLLNTDKLLNKLEQLLCKCDFDSAVYAGNMLGRYREREVVKREYFGTAKLGDFEGIKVNIPEKSHELQTALYGNYMELPPESQRVAHNIIINKCRRGF